MDNASDPIESIADALRIVKAFEGSDFADDTWPFHKFPFWLWFRGQSKHEELKPFVFRSIHRSNMDQSSKSPNTNTDETWDETNLFNHLKLRLPGHRQSCHSAFDWLCQMQHYSLPTRLLDWSESILPALYFAVKDHENDPGYFFVLNARRLNYQTKRRPTMFIATDDHVSIRAEMAHVFTVSQLETQPSVVNAAARCDLLADKGNGALEFKEGWVREFLRPIAVMPNRLNDRMIFQTSVFTLHGGKKCSAEKKNTYTSEFIPDPISLEEMNDCEDDKKCLFKKYSISKSAKAVILRDLILLGIHEGTLFPEIDRQATYLKSLWRFTQ